MKRLHPGSKRHAGLKERTVSKGQPDSKIQQHHLISAPLPADPAVSCSGSILHARLPPFMPKANRTARMTPSPHAKHSAQKLLLLSTFTTAIVYTLPTPPSCQPAPLRVAPRGGRATGARRVRLRAVPPLTMEGHFEMRSCTDLGMRLGESPPSEQRHPSPER
jgi:hypothetical protein